jgi:hypothetical protein
MLLLWLLRSLVMGYCRRGVGRLLSRGRSSPAISALGAAPYVPLAIAPSAIRSITTETATVAAHIAASCIAGGCNSR